MRTSLASADLSSILCKQPSSNLESRRRKAIVKRTHAGSLVARWRINHSMASATPSSASNLHFRSHTSKSTAISSWMRPSGSLCSHEERCRRPASLHDGPRTRRRIRPSPGDRKLLAGRRHRGRIDDGNSEQLFAAQKTLTATAARMLSAVSMALLQPCE